MYVLLRHRCLLDVYLVVFLFNLGIIMEVKSDGGISDHMAKIKAVKDAVLRDYDKTIRPTLGESNTTEVRTAFIPRQIIGLDEETGLLSLDSVLWLTWPDPRLKWNKDDYSGLLQIPTKLLWVPDITVHNSHSLRVDPTEEVLIVVEPSGQVYWVPPVLTQTTCATDPTQYPWDETTCIVTFGSWTHDGWEVDFQHDDHLFMKEFANINPRWELLVDKAGLRRNVQIYECCPEPYLSLEVILPLKRRPVPEIEATRIPCILIMLLALSIFWLPPDSPKKLMLGGMLFLVSCVLLVYVAWCTKFSLAVINAVTFIQTTMYIVVTSILLQVLVVTKLCSLDGPMRPPPAAIELLNGPLGKWVCLRSPLSEDNLPLDRVQLREESTTQDSPSIKEEWMLFAAALDRVLFIVMMVIMVAVHHL